ncbi:MAG TPA: hypothetical protein PK199_09470 [Bacteroidales bacterium]|nr:hypothetical protein [Bacteroidales bacterium]
MKKLLYYVYALVVITSACTPKDTDTKDSDCGKQNHLIPSTVSLVYEQTMVVPQEYAFFFKTIDFQKLTSDIIEKSKKGTIVPLFPFSDIPLTKQDIEEKLSTVSIQECKYALFDEEWFMDTATFVMQKNVRSYTIVREYMRKTPLGTEELSKSLIAKIPCTDSVSKKFSELTLLAKNVAYEIPLVNEFNPEYLENIHVKHVMNILIAKALSGTTNAYSFMLRDTLQSLSAEDIKLRLGEQTESYVNIDETTGDEDSVKIEKKIDPSEYTGLAFIEDWYVNPKTMHIYKDVKGVALVREYMKQLDGNEPEKVKTIPLLMFFSNHKDGK